jgi:hypothetical protein
LSATLYVKLLCKLFVKIVVLRDELNMAKHKRISTDRYVTMQQKASLEMNAKEEHYILLLTQKLTLAEVYLKLQ